ncbi:hypothetical protein D1007_28839 [Hordeum vulgare]|nr:hypothetical protein D1007_28839 [Hordeum vulgare]
MPKETTRSRRKLSSDEEDTDFIPKESAPEKQKEKTIVRKTVRKEPDWLDGFLKEKMYTFVGFDITRDKLMLKNSGLEINLDVASKVVHPFYKDMKKKIDRKEDHKLWGITQLPDYLIQYAAIDAYASYKAWRAIDIVIKGLCRLNYDEQFGTPYDY